LKFFFNILKVRCFVSLATILESSGPIYHHGTREGNAERRALAFGHYCAQQQEKGRTESSETYEREFYSMSEWDRRQFLQFGVDEAARRAEPVAARQPTPDEEHAIGVEARTRVEKMRDAGQRAVYVEELNKVRAERYFAPVV
jgi:hypothetical protein